jgi:hypothetical protein
MVYIVYKTTNKINGKIYVGVHKQKNLDFDGYYGSGILLSRAIVKYGIENFYRETLFVFDNIKDCYQKEKEIVNENFCKDDMTYNIAVGGCGGCTTVGYDEYKIKLIKEKAKKTNLERGNYIYTGEKLKKSQERMKAVRIQPNNLGIKHEGIELENIRMAAKQRRGKYFWITDGINTKNIGANEEIPEGWYRGRGVDYERFQKHSENSKKKIADKITGDVCYNDGKVNLKLKIGDVPPPGFVKGMIQNHRNYFWITNGVETKKLFSDEKVPEGWYKGRTFKKRNNVDG